MNQLLIAKHSFPKPCRRTSKSYLALAHQAPETKDSDYSIEEASHRRKRRRRLIKGHVAPLSKDDIVELSSESSYRGSSPDESTTNREKKTEPYPVHEEVDSLGSEAVIIEEEIKTKELWQIM